MKDSREYRNAQIVGLAVFIGYIVFVSFPFSESKAGRLLLGLEVIIFRVFACMWISSLVKRLGRKPLGYVLAAIIFPTIMLIIVGSMGIPQRNASNEPR